MSDFPTQLITIITTLLGSGALFTFIQFLITRIDGKKNKIKEIHTQLSAITTSINRLDTKIDDIQLKEQQTQLAMLMKDYPDRHAKIYKIAENYFANGGDDWITDMFQDWLNSEKEVEPDWFVKHKREHK